MMLMMMEYVMLMKISGCTDNTACNYDFSATDSDDSLCTYQSTYYYDADGDGLGDDSEVLKLFVQIAVPADFVSIMMIHVQMMLRMMQMETEFVRVMR